MIEELGWQEFIRRSAIVRWLKALSDKM